MEWIRIIGFYDVSSISPTNPTLNQFYNIPKYFNGQLPGHNAESDNLWFDVMNTNLSIRADFKL